MDDSIVLKYLLESTYDILIDIYDISIDKFDTLLNLELIYIELARNNIILQWIFGILVLLLVLLICIFFSIYFSKLK